MANTTQPTENQKVPASRITLALLLALLGTVLTSCQTTGTSSSGRAKALPASKMKSPAVQSRNQQIAMETPGDHYIARRWFTDGTRYWGYIRKPRQTWDKATLFVMDEASLRQPDRLPETPADGNRAHGFDHNHEYKMWGAFTSEKIYDPNSDLVLPSFRLSRYELISANPGFLFYPGEPYERRGLPPMHPPKP